MGTWRRVLARFQSARVFHLALTLKAGRIAASTALAARSLFALALRLATTVQQAMRLPHAMSPVIATPLPTAMSRLTATPLPAMTPLPATPLPTSMTHLVRRLPLACSIRAALRRLRRSRTLHKVSVRSEVGCQRGLEVRRPPRTMPLRGIRISRPRRLGNPPGIDVLGARAIASLRRVRMRRACGARSL